MDPLASNKGFWAQVLGVGDFYYELAVQVRLHSYSNIYIHVYPFLHAFPPGISCRSPPSYI